MVIIYYNNIIKFNFMVLHAYFCIRYYKNSANSIILEPQKISLSKVLVSSNIRSIYPKIYGILNGGWISC